MTSLMHRNPMQTLLPTGQRFSKDVTTHAFPGGGINAEGDQGTPNRHHDPGSRQTQGWTKGAEDSDAGNGDACP
jgi:hypothetical protein